MKIHTRMTAAKSSQFFVRRPWTPYRQLPEFIRSFLPQSIFSAVADSLLFFKVIEESEYSKYWSGYPRISKILPGVDETRRGNWARSRFTRGDF